MSSISINVEEVIKFIFRRSYLNIFSNKDSEYFITAKVLNNTLYSPIGIFYNIPSLRERNADYVFGIGNINRSIIAKTSTKIMEHAFGKNRLSSIFINTEKGYSYIAAYNILFTQDMNPLMMFMYKDEQFAEFNVRKPILMVSPRVYASTDLMSKYIVKTLIPNIHNIQISGYDSGIEVVVSHDIDSFIHKASSPIDADFNKALYNILESNIEDIEL